MADLVPVAAAISVTATAVLDKTHLCGEALGAGTACYLKASDDRIWQADANASGTATVHGINLVATAAAAQPCAVQTGGICDIGVACLLGQPYVLSETAGGLSLDSDIGAGVYKSKIGTGNGTMLVMGIHNSGVANA